MVDFLKGWVINIATVSIFIVLLEMMLPSGKTKKFLNLISGFIIIAVIITPFTGLLGKGTDLRELRIADENIIDRKELESGMNAARKNQMKQIAAVYRQKLARNIEDAACTVKGVSSARADVVINEDPESGDYGEIKRVYLYVGTVEKSRSVKRVARVEKVKIGNKTGKGNPGDRGREITDGDLKGRIEEKLSSMFGIGRDLIVVDTENGN